MHGAATSGGQPGRAGAANTLSDILRDVDTALFHWTAADDRIRWSANAPDLFHPAGRQAPRTNAHFMHLLDPEKRLAREGAIAHAFNRSGQTGGKYDFVFQLTIDGPRGRAKVCWFEERGHVLHDAGGNVIGINGSLRSITAPMATAATTGDANDTDALSGALTRASFTARLGEDIAAARKSGGGCCLLVMGIDNLAMINDSFGFETADSVITEIARRVTAVLREGDIIGRLAGNKFAVILHNCTSEEAAVAARRFCESVSQSPVTTENSDVVATISVGGVIFPRFAPDAERAITRAMEALQQARKSRRGGFRMYEPDTRREVERRDNLRLATDLLSALSEQRMGLALQPIVSTEDDEPAFYESLVRVRSRDGEDVSAGAFMNLADRLGLTHLIDTRVLDLTVELLIAEPDLKVSINVGVSTALDPDWFQRITDHVLHNRDIAHRMIVEITETEAIQDIQETAAVVSWMHDLGCKVALDDFGAGYTTYRNLRDLGVDMVKIDGSFMRNLHRSEADQLFVQTLVNLARNLGIETVAEWVEDERDAQLLKDWGVTYLQGHLYGRATTRYMPCDSTLPLVSEKKTSRGS